MKNSARKCFAQWVTSPAYHYSITPVREKVTKRCDTYRFLELSPIVKAVVSDESLDIWCHYNFPDEDNGNVFDFNLATGCAPQEDDEGWFNSLYVKEHQPRYQSFNEMVVNCNFEPDISMLSELYLAGSVVYLFARGGNTDGGVLTKKQFLHKVEKWVSVLDDDLIFVRPLSKVCCL